MANAILIMLEIQSPFNYSSPFSLHPHDNLVAISTGQRVFPDLISRLFPADNDSPAVSPSIGPPSKEEEEQSAVGEEYTQMGKGSPLENSIKLYRFKSC
jgi:hypothetical protein